MSAAFQRSRLGLADANGDLYLDLEYPFIEHPVVTEVNHSLDEAQILYSLAMAASGWIATNETEYILGVVSPCHWHPRCFFSRGQVLK